MPKRRKPKLEEQGSVIPITEFIPKSKPPEIKLVRIEPSPKFHFLLAV